MNIKQDPRHYYIKGLLSQCYESPFDDDYKQKVHTVFQKYRIPGLDNEQVAIMDKNTVIIMSIDYIADLEKEVEKLQYVARIIEMAKENNNG